MLISLLLFLVIIAVFWFILRALFVRYPQYVGYRTHSNVALVVLVVIAALFMWHGGHFHR